jgi:hypothetical protein
MVKSYGSGWFREYHRHSLAARGIKTSLYAKQRYSWDEIKPPVAERELSTSELIRLRKEKEEKEKQEKRTEAYKYGKQMTKQLKIDPYSLKYSGVKDLAKRAIMEGKLPQLEEIYKDDPMFAMALREAKKEVEKVVLHRPISTGIAALDKDQARIAGEILSKKGELTAFERQRLTEIFGGDEALADKLMASKVGDKVSLVSDVTLVANKLNNLQKFVEKGGPEFEFAKEDFDKTIANLKLLRRDRYGVISEQISEFDSEADALEDRRRLNLDLSNIEYTKTGTRIPYGTEFERETRGQKKRRLAELDEERVTKPEEQRQFLKTLGKKTGTVEEKPPFVSSGIRETKPTLSGITLLYDKLGDEFDNRSLVVRQQLSFYKQNYPQRKNIINKLENEVKRINQMSDKFKELIETRRAINQIKFIKDPEKKKAEKEALRGRVGSLEAELGIVIPVALRAKLGDVKSVDDFGGRSPMKSELTEVVSGYGSRISSMFPTIKMAKKAIKKETVGREVAMKEYEKYMDTLTEKDLRKLEVELDKYHAPKPQKPLSLWIEPEAEPSRKELRSVLKRLPLKEMVPAPMKFSHKPGEKTMKSYGQWKYGDGPPYWARKIAASIAQKGAIKAIKRGVEPKDAKIIGSVIGKRYLRDQISDLEQASARGKFKLVDGMWLEAR